VWAGCSERAWLAGRLASPGAASLRLSVHSSLSVTAAAAAVCTVASFRVRSTTAVVGPARQAVSIRSFVYLQPGLSDFFLDLAYQRVSCVQEIR